MFIFNNYNNSFIYYFIENLNFNMKFHFNSNNKSFNISIYN